MPSEDTEKLCFCQKNSGKLILEDNQNAKVLKEKLDQSPMTKIILGDFFGVDSPDGYSLEYL